MDQPITGQIICEHLDANPESGRALLHDPQYAAETHRLRMVLNHLDEALADEGLTGEARHRVGARLAAAWLGTDAAHARVQFAKQLMAQGEVRVPAEFL
ncbi:hypothetical protein [Streptomyces sp. NPDC001750]|uniref:hypothetical protein n=1 Tax=Streptomyces sp. NPDC001750 TaxID=3364607 RepID=UPI0036C5BA53